MLHVQKTVHWWTFKVKKYLFVILSEARAANGPRWLHALFFRMAAC